MDGEYTMKIIPEKGKSFWESKKVDFKITIKTEKGTKIFKGKLKEVV